MKKLMEQDRLSIELMAQATMHPLETVQKLTAEVNWPEKQTRHGLEWE